ncbi:MAG: iron-containing redox enzyme family protein [Myxococcota bacterium]|nr:iron-containing redox enzyme family protein [Myxococcota bacterium]
MQSIADDLAHLQQYVESHFFWDNPVFQACERGELAMEDFRVLFGQYSHYTKNFTRYLAGVMFSCADDLLRARLSENLWEEGGGTDPAQRHAELYRLFMSESLGIADPIAVAPAEYTSAFVEHYLRGASSPDHTYSCAFLSLGTEGIVSRMYQILVKGMLKAGFAVESLGFFQLHIQCDDAHAETLLEMLLASRSRPDWREVAVRAVDDALGARAAFFEALYTQLRPQPVCALIDAARSRQPIVPPPDARHRYRRDEPGEGLYSNQNPRLSIDFDVTRMHFDGGQVLDTRTVHVAPHARNERHQHAHEALFHVLRGEGVVHIGKKQISVSLGDTVFIPRWIFHQTQNTTSEPLVLLAITDFGFTAAVLGDYDRRTRLKKIDPPSES